jgi:ABC-type multidrug transport system ATPase subunit
VIILISIFFEKICIYLLNKLLEVVMKAYIKTKYSSKNTTCKDKSIKKYKIILKNISKSYGKKLVLNEVNINIDNTCPVFIMGESGVGKTTLIKIILGFIKNYSGSFKIENSVNNEVYKSELKMAAVFQEDRLLEYADVYTNIYAILGDKFSKNEIDKHLNELGLKGEGNKKVSELSGGMKRRVELMRAVLSEADVYILDEAFKGLDDKNRDISIEYVKKYTLGKILIVVSHDILESEKFNAKVVKLDESQS